MRAGAILRGMFGHELASGVAGMIFSLFAPLAQTALVAPTTGALDCSIWTSQSGITAGAATELTWWSVNASHATITETGGQPVNVPISGNRSVSPNTSRTYTLFVANQYGQSKICSVSVQVAPAATQAPSCTLTVPPGNYTAGQPVRLFWVTQNAQAAGITGLGTIDTARIPYGNADVYPSQNTLYTMTVANQSGSRTCSALVTLTQRQTTTTRPTATTYTVPRTVSTPSYTSRPTSFSAPSYRPAYSAAPSNAYGGGSYSSYSPYYGESYSLYSPSYEYGLGDYSLTNVWNDFGSGEYLRTDHDCYWGACNSEPSAWEYTSPGGYDTRIGWYDEYGHGQQYTYDASGNLIGANREVSLDYFNNFGGVESTSDDPYYSPGLNPYPSLEETAVSVPGVVYDSTGYRGLEDAGAFLSPPAASPFDYYGPSVYYEEVPSYGPSTDGLMQPDSWFNGYESWI